MGPVDVANDLFRAIRGGDLMQIRDLLEAEPQAARARDAGGTTALQLAAYLRNHEAVRLLLQHDALATVHEAAVLGDTEAIVRLLDAHPEQLDEPGPDGFRPLHLAAHFAQHDALERLLERGADIAARSTNANENTALHAAAAGAAVATARILLASGADADARDAGGNTPLHIAAANGAVPVLQALLDGGADPAARNDQGEIPVDLAQQRGKSEAAALLGQAAEA